MLFNRTTTWCGLCHCVKKGMIHHSPPHCCLWSPFPLQPAVSSFESLHFLPPTHSLTLWSVTSAFKTLSLRSPVTSCCHILTSFFLSSLFILSSNIWCCWPLPEKCSLAPGLHYFPFPSVTVCLLSFWLPSLSLTPPSVMTFLKVLRMADLICS